MPAASGTAGGGGGGSRSQSVGHSDVSIDRRVFRRLRRRHPSGGASGDGAVEGVGTARVFDSGGVPLMPLSAQRAVYDLRGGNARGSAALEEEEDLEYYGDDGFAGPIGLEDVEDYASESQGLSRVGSAPCLQGAEAGSSSWPSSPPPRRAGLPRTPGWLATPPKGRRPRTDPVSRGAEMRALWSKDRFLRVSGQRKFDLRGCGAEFAPPPRRGGSMIIPNYVPPHEKSRYDVRMQVRQQMMMSDYA